MNQTHPITGEAIGLGEYVSWKIQNLIRRWAFILSVTAATAVCWATRNGHVLTWWNYTASWMALFIESVVGISMYKQTQSDAAVIRKILKMETAQFEEIKDLITRVETDLEVMHYPEITDKDNN